MDSLVMPEDKDSYVFLRFFGPYADDGKIDLEKAGKTLVALDSWFKRYKRDFVKSDQKIVLRAGAIQKNCSEIQIFMDAAIDLAKTTHADVLATVYGLSKIVRLDEFLKQFMGTLGQQLALKIFANGKPLTAGKKTVKESVPMIELKNDIGQIRAIPLKEWEVYSATGHYLNGLHNLETGKEDRLAVGYRLANSPKENRVAEITALDKNAFTDINDPDALAQRLKEPFEESKADEVKLIGQFVDYFGLAQKYHFSFQVRKNQAEFGKQKIICIVEKSQISSILDLLKPENKKNVHISGKATKDRDGKLDKIKIDIISTNPDYDPNQTSLIQDIKA